MNIRTVRLLSAEPGEATETRYVEGVLVEKGIHLKTFHNGLMRIVAALEVGESFLWPYNSFARAKLRPKKFATKRVGNKYRIWRVK